MEVQTSHKLRDSIILKLLKVVFVIYFFVTFTVTCIHLLAEYGHSRDELKKGLESFQNIFEPGLASALWNLDEPQIVSTLSGMLKSPIVQGIRLQLIDTTSPKEKVWEIGYIPAEEDTHNLTTLPHQHLTRNDIVFRRFSHSFDVFYETPDGLKWLVGSATLYSSRDVILSQIETSFTYIIVNAIIKTIVLWALFIWAGRMYLSQPLTRLVRTFENIRLKSLDAITPTTEVKGNDELKTLERAFNKMIRKLNVEVRERKQVQKQHEAAKEFLDNIISSMPSALMGLDAYFIVTHWNPKAAEFTHVSADEAEGRLLIDVFPPLKQYVPQIKEVLKHAQPKKLSNLPLEFLGSSYFIDLTVYPLSPKHSDSAVILMDDVTQRVHLEGMMVQTEKMRTVAGLGAGIAHEINNPLGIILQSTQNIKRRIAPDFEKNIIVAKEHNFNLDQMNAYLAARQIPSFLDSIVTAGERASHIIQTMLTFSRHSKPTFNKTSVNHMIDEALELASNDYALKKEHSFSEIKIIKHFDDSLPQIDCEPTQLAQVLFNVIKNAAQALFSAQRQENKIVTITTQRQNTSISIEIRDNGPGIDKETQKRLFEPFYTTKEPGMGTGLGLYVSYFIITNNHKGALSVDSSIGQGTSVHIELPIEQATHYVTEQHGENT